MKGWQIAIVVAIAAGAFLLVLKALLQSTAPVIKQSDNPLVHLIDAIPQVVGAWRSRDGSTTTNSVDAISGA